MSRDFIGSKISIITKSQCRYSGTIIGIDSETSSIILGNVKSFGTENRSGHLTNGHSAGTVLPIMQFANSDIEDLKIVDEESTSATSQQQAFSKTAVSSPPLPPPSQQPASIHDDPAIVSAVVSSANKDSASASSRLIHNLQRMNLNDGQSKTDESRFRSSPGELGGTPWSLLSSSKWDTNNSKSSSSQQAPGNKSKFFDDFIANKNSTNQHQFNRTYQRSSNTHSTQTARENGGSQYDENGLPVRQPFFSNDRPYPQRQQQQQQQQHHQQQFQQNRYQNGNDQYRQRNFQTNRRPNYSNQQRRGGGRGGIGGNRETFQDNPNDYDADFDFETSNLKFNKLTNEDESNNQTDLPEIETNSSSDHHPLYDKKKSFFDNLMTTEPSDGPQGYNRSKNFDTFGNDGYHRQQNDRYGGGGGGGYRRSNNNNYRQHNNNNGYHYRY